MFFTFSRNTRQTKRRAPRLQVERLEDRDCPSGGYLVVTSYDNHAVPRFDAATGADAGPYVTHRSGGLDGPYGVIYSPHDGNLFVSSGLFSGKNVYKGVLRYDRTTGAFLDAFTEEGHLTSPRGIIFGPDGHLYVADRLLGPGVDDNTGRIVRFDGTTGAFLDEFVPTGGVGRTSGLVFGPDPDNPGQLDLYCTSVVNGSVSRFDGATGAYRGEFVAPGSGGLDYPIGLTFGPDGSLYVTSFARGTGYQAVLRYQGPSGATPGAFIDAFVPPGQGGLQAPFGLLFGPDGNGDGHQDLYVTTAEMTKFLSAKVHSSAVLRYDGVTGAFLDTFVDYGSGRLDNPALMTFTETDPVTLAYTGGSTSRAAPSPSAGSTPSASAATRASGGGRAVLTDPDGNAFPLTFALTASLQSDGSVGGVVNFVFGADLGRAWGAVPFGREGGIDNAGRATATITRTLIENNQAIGGSGTVTGGDGIGGGVYNVAGGTVWVDVLTRIVANDASTSDDDVFGILTPL